MNRELDEDDVWISDEPAAEPSTEPEATSDEQLPPRTRWFALKAGVVAVALGAIVIGATAKSLENVAPSDSPAGTTTTTTVPATTTEPGVAPEPTVPPAEPGEWPRQLDGVPASASTLVSATDALEGEVRPGLYLWADFNGWHLRLVNGGDIAGAVGTINSDLPVESVSSSNPTAGTVTTEETSVTFDLPGDVAVAGIDFSPAFFAENMVLVFDEANPLTAEQIYLGQLEVTPGSVPLVLQKPADG